MSPALRRSTSLTLDRRLLDEARALGVNVSRAAEEGLVARVRAARTAHWQRENAIGIEEYNAFIAVSGIPLRDHRKF